jgi:anti-sigma regulatory factor (Ser/Thr protein kinase)
MELPSVDHNARIVLPAVEDSVAYVRRAVTEMARALGAEEALVRRIALAVSEAVTNVVLHAFDGEPGQVSATIERNEDELQIVVTDDGGGLVPRSDSPGLGMGLGIIAEVTDRLSIKSGVGRGTRLVMGFAAPQRESPRAVG